jgi:hypothetical protein
MEENMTQRNFPEIFGSGVIVATTTEDETKEDGDEGELGDAVLPPSSLLSAAVCEVQVVDRVWISR